MENLETYLYVFFAVVYIISRVIKARAKQNAAQKPAAKPQNQMQPQTANKPQQPKKGFSFDDILKEFEKNLRGGEYAEEEAIPVKELKYEEPVPVAVKAKEEAPNPFHDYKNVNLRSFEKAQDPIFVRNENFKIKENIANEYVKMLRDPNGFRNAVVLSEIINRKYF